MGVSDTMNPSGIPRWLSILILGRFYKQCKFHDKFPCKYFCIDCMQDAMCTMCNDQHKKFHDNHRILEACKASHEATIRIPDLTNLWSDVSEITPFKINNHRIVFINTKGGKRQSASVNGCGRCTMCQYTLKEPSTFCSIECYVRYYENVQQQYNRENAIQVEKKEAASQSLLTVEIGREDQQSKDSVNVNSCATEPNKSFRKRSRKGIPVRARTGDFLDDLRFNDDFKLHR